VGKLRLGFSDMTLIDAFSWMEAGDKSLRLALEDAYNISADIGLIIKTLKEDGIAGVKKMSITPGIPIRPAAAERLADAHAIYQKLGDCVAQPKLDGFRLQVHVNKIGNDVAIHFFSRNLIDMSNMFPDLAQAVKKLDVVSFVAEGEAISYDVESGQFLPFQETVKRKRKHDIEKVAEDFPLKLYFFDLLFLNGTSLLGRTHEERRTALAKIIDTSSIKKNGVMVLVDEIEIKDAQYLEAYFNETVSVGLEGLVVKRLDAVYQPGKRNFNWIKLKRQETGSLDDTIDCVILGYYGGHGKRAAFGIGALLVGVYNSEKDLFQTVAKIGTGLTDEEWKKAKELCDAIKVQHKPAHVECHKDLSPEVWVQPELVCMIRADEITRSPLHQAGATSSSLGFALRFPRFMGYREDKSATDATTVDELIEMFSMQFQKKKKPALEQEKQQNLKFN
jgi:DNA ligase-1